MECIDWGHTSHPSLSTLFSDSYTTIIVPCCPCLNAWLPRATSLGSTPRKLCSCMHRFQISQHTLGCLLGGIPNVFYGEGGLCSSSVGTLLEFGIHCGAFAEPPSKERQEIIGFFHLTTGTIITCSWKSILLHLSIFPVESVRLLS